MNILIAEDTEDARLILKTTLTSAGYDVRDAPNGAAALKMAIEFPPDIIISDILMPEMDGFAFCREVKQDSKLNKIPFIFYTATYTDPKDERLAMSLGASRFILKPMENDKFLRIIEEVISEYKDNKLQIPETTLENEDTIKAMHEDSLSRKLDKKIKDLEKEHKALQEKEAILRGSEVRYRKLMETANDAIFVANAETGIIVDANTQAEKLIGKPLEKIIGMRQIELHPKEESERYREIFEKHVQTGQAISEALFVINSSGKRIPVEISAKVLEIEGKTFIQGIFRDIRERVILEEQLLHSQKMEAVGQLAAGISHEFNNILSAIVNYAYLLQIHSKEDDTLKSYNDKILSLTGKAAEITRSLLSFSRKHFINPVPLNLNNSVRNMENLLTKFIGEDIELITKLTDESPVILADSAQIEQIVINLATNARDAMSEGGILTIETEIMEMDSSFIKAHGFGRPGTFTIISISDTGRGMDEDTRKKIFEPFFTTKEVGKGTGLGLSIIYGIVKQHDGYINVYSEPGRGTSFKIYFETTGADVEESDKTVLSGLTGNGETILLAEDDPSVRHSVKMILENSGYMVIEAQNGQEAIEKFIINRDSIRLLVLDVIMPQKSGRETHEEIQKLAPQIRAIYTSGYPSEIMSKKGILRDGTLYIEKPISPDKLLGMIYNVLHEQGV